MAYSVFSYGSGGSGRAASGAVNPLRAPAPDRKAPDSLIEERPSIEERKPAPPREDAAKEASKRRSGDPRAEAAARRAARLEGAEDGRAPLTSPEERAEDIRKLEQLEAEALFTGPPTQRERAVAQLARALIVRESAELRAHELEEVWKERERREIARFIAAQAAAAYRELDGYAGYKSLPLIH